MKGFNNIDELADVLKSTKNTDEAVDIFKSAKLSNTEQLSLIKKLDDPSIIKKLLDSNIPTSNKTAIFDAIKQNPNFVKYGLGTAAIGGAAIGVAVKANEEMGRVNDSIYKITKIVLLTFPYPEGTYNISFSPSEKLCSTDTITLSNLNITPNLNGSYKPNIHVDGTVSINTPFNEEITINSTQKDGSLGDLKISTSQECRSKIQRQELGGVFGDIAGSAAGSFVDVAAGAAGSSAPSAFNALISNPIILAIIVLFVLLVLFR